MPTSVNRKWEFGASDVLGAEGGRAVRRGGNEQSEEYDCVVEKCD